MSRAWVTFGDGTRRATPPIRISQVGPGVWRGTCTIPTRYGPIVLTATCSDRGIKRLVALELRRRGGASVGGLFESVGRLAKKIVSKKVMRQIASGYKKLARSPIVQAGVAASLSSLGVPPQVSVTALKASASLVDMADGPDPRKRAAARARIADIRARAESGDPTAVQAFATVRAAYTVQQAERGKAPGAPALRAAPAARPASGARIVSARRAPNGKMLLAVEVGGPTWDWFRQNWGYRRGLPSPVYSVRDAYRAAAQAYGVRARSRAAA